MKNIINLVILFILIIRFDLMAQSPLIILMGNEQIIEAPNCITDGTFDDGSSWLGWSLGDIWDITGGVASYNNTGLGNLRQAQASMATEIVENTDYTLSFDITGGTADIWFLDASDNIQYIARTTYAIGHHSIDFTSPANIAAGGIDLYTNTNAVFQIDNIRLILR